MDRYTRQERLAEIGRTGQARIASARVELRLNGLAAQVAAKYLAGAGVESVQVKPCVSDDDQGVDALGMRDPVARDLARGAQAALRAIHEALRGAR